jgi:hypothetical protein
MQTCRHPAVLALRVYTIPVAAVYAALLVQASQPRRLRCIVLAAAAACPAAPAAPPQPTAPLLPFVPVKMRDMPKGGASEAYSQSGLLPSCKGCAHQVAGPQVLFVHALHIM